MDTSLTLTRRRVVFRQGTQQSDEKKGAHTTTKETDSKQSSRGKRTSAVPIEPARSSTSSESSSSILTPEALYQGESLRRSTFEQREESGLELLSKNLTLDEEKPVKYVEAIAKSFKRPQEPFQWKTSYISIPSNVISPKSLLSLSNQKRSRDSELSLSNNLAPGKFPTLIRRLCHEHSRIRMKKPKSSTSGEYLRELKENNCERCQMMTSWMVAIRQAVVAASTLPFDPRYHYVSYSVDKRGIIYCNEPLIRFLPVRNSAEEAPRKRARTEVRTRSYR
ncbi:hypothetical protein Gasu2_36390 [Galdieria sulphuraria]|uniref:Uncharacterized protein n=1 Tax=Galdieria sulphuraria TaxID=130081 RepID=M2VV93_GALSU|nr:uncharacterized protein Gasu_52390 [Galdieria sulphuraria]EME27136.1 hypothetical protein Gasu_52390 [Galdieria sulphuraria]GJD09383.1 hypothetical protein Gasu2_36390 [Galdieria sulphuraria]|eukprot:XP_005703656.1 hypothetical protein Gasu_52390 [Galdieria sulphuraria]